MNLFGLFSRDRYTVELLADSVSASGERLTTFGLLRNKYGFPLEHMNRLRAYAYENENGCYALLSIIDVHKYNDCPSEARSLVKQLKRIAKNSSPRVIEAGQYHLPFDIPFARVYTQMMREKLIEPCDHCEELQVIAAQLKICIVQNYYACGNIPHSIKNFLSIYDSLLATEKKTLTTAAAHCAQSQSESSPHGNYIGWKPLSDFV